MEAGKPGSTYAQLIAEGKVAPLTDEEREILKNLRTYFDNRLAPYRARQARQEAREARRAERIADRARCRAERALRKTERQAARLAGEGR